MDFIKHENYRIVVVCVGINDIKYIWDHYSLPTGDNCVILVAARLKKVVKEVFRVAFKYILGILYAIPVQFAIVHLILPLASPSMRKS